MRIKRSLLNFLVLGIILALPVNGERPNADSFDRTEQTSKELCCGGEDKVIECDREIGWLICEDGSISECQCTKRNPFLLGDDPVPQNAHVNAYDDGWECNKGYIVVDQDYCVKFENTPIDARINEENMQWDCDDSWGHISIECVDKEHSD